MREASYCGGLGNGRPDTVGIGFFPCALYSLRQQARPGEDRTEGPGPEDNLLQGEHRHTPENGSGNGGQISTPEGDGVPPEKDSAGQHENEYEQTQP